MLLSSYPEFCSRIDQQLAHANQIQWPSGTLALIVEYHKSQCQRSELV
jgi:hypothetical protein